MSGLPMTGGKPPWLRKKLSFSLSAGVKNSLRSKKLHTVCESARCPNISECFSKNTATFMILGNRCSRTCTFCSVEKAAPARLFEPDPEEPMNISGMIKELGIRHAVITSVTRDDMPDGGAEHFARVTETIRKNCPGVSVELLIPDFRGDAGSLKKVFDEKPDILNHNIETVPSLYRRIRPQADFEQSLKVLRLAAEYNLTTKSGIMVGLGETEEELMETIKRLKENMVQILTIGQYLQPSRQHAPVVAYRDEKWFGMMEERALAIGIPRVFSGPFVRSSYMAEQVAAI